MGHSSLGYEALPIHSLRSIHGSQELIHLTGVMKNVPFLPVARNKVEQALVMHLISNNPIQTRRPMRHRKFNRRCSSIQIRCGQCNPTHVGGLNGLTQTKLAGEQILCTLHQRTTVNILIPKTRSTEV